MKNISKATATKILDLVLMELKERSLLDLSDFAIDDEDEPEIGCKTYDEILDTIQSVKY